MPDDGGQTHSPCGAPRGSSTRHGPRDPGTARASARNRMRPSPGAPALVVIGPCNRAPTRHATRFPQHPEKPPTTGTLNPRDRPRLRGSSGLRNRSKTPRLSQGSATASGSGAAPRLRGRSQAPEPSQGSGAA
nr:hypothetical protein GCM10010200_012960 [Actinomadura rugatobispora]